MTEKIEEEGSREESESASAKEVTKSYYNSVINDDEILRMRLPRDLS